MDPELAQVGLSRFGPRCRCCRGSFGRRGHLNVSSRRFGEKRLAGIARGRVVGVSGTCSEAELGWRGGCKLKCECSASGFAVGIIGDAKDLQKITQRGTLR